MGASNGPSLGNDTFWNLAGLGLLGFLIMAGFALIVAQIPPNCP